MALQLTYRSKRRWFAVCVIIFCALIWGEIAHSRIKANHVVRVTVTDRNNVGQSATEFLWQNNRQVVTSLHGVLHKALPGRTIRVFCNGVPTEANVSGVLQRADLVLLKPVKPVKGCKIFKDNLQGLTADQLKPAPETRLYTFGWKGAATSSTSRYIWKGATGGRETLNGLVDNEETKEIIRTLRLPSLNLSIYYVQGPLGGGYSGAPVVDPSGKLVGIVDGGLDKGRSDYNWLIPATYLISLTSPAARKVKTVPKVDLNLLDNHFSAGLVEPRGTQTEVLFTPQPGMARKGSRYHFVKTKTRTLASLASTSDDPAGIRQLVRYFRKALRSDVEHRLRFDIFEDLKRSLIIAVPVGQGLIDGPVPGYPAIHLLRSEAATPGDEIQFEELVPDAQGYQQAATGSDGRAYLPYERGYFNAYIYQTVMGCRSRGNKCYYIKEITSQRQFPNGNKVMSFGVYSKPNSESYPSFFYYSVAVRQNVAFIARAQIQNFPNREDLIQCVFSKAPCRNTSTSFKQLSQLVAAQLTTFGN